MKILTVFRLTVLHRTLADHMNDLDIPKSVFMSQQNHAAASQVHYLNGAETVLIVHLRFMKRRNQSVEASSTI